MDKIFLFLKKLLTLILFFIAFFIYLNPLYAQIKRNCGTPLAIKEALQKHPNLIKRYQYIQQGNSITPFSNQKITRKKSVSKIPVVVHVVLKDPTKVTDAQIQSQIDVLNQDYQFRNPDQSNIPDVWQSIAGNMNIQFCLAKRSPDNEPTNGIVRVKTNQSSFTITDAVKAVKHDNTGGADAWDSHRYLNIWICNLRGDFLGVGTPPVIYPDNEQGVVIQYNAFGTVGNLLPDYNKGRSCTHELGHFLNLLHLWGESKDDACNLNDYIADTPPQKGPVYGAPTFPDLSDPCSPNAPGIMINNFMGYVNDASMNMFTQDQVDRARSALLNYHTDLLNSNACQPVHLERIDARLRSISSPRGKLCHNIISPKITLQNFGTQTLNKVSIKYRIDNGQLKTFQWQGHLDSLDSIQITLPQITATEGTHQLQVITDQPNGTNDQRTDNDTLYTQFHLDPIMSAPYTEDFESGSFPPQGWTLYNPDQQLTWEQTNSAAFKGSHSIIMKNLDYAQNGPIDDIISPVIDIQNKDSAFLYFDLAAAVQSDPNGNNTYWDTLKVLISFDCGQTGTVIYKKSGKQLITTEGQYKYEFVPRSNQWRRDSIDLTDFLYRGPFRIIFRNISNFENNIYLDHIQLSAKNINPMLQEKKILVSPNPFTRLLQVQFLDLPENLKAVSIYNTSGQLVSQKSQAAINSGNKINFYLKDLPAGIYFVQILNGDEKIVKKVLKLQ